MCEIFYTILIIAAKIQLHINFGYTFIIIAFYVEFLPFRVPFKINMMLEKAMTNLRFF